MSVTVVGVHRVRARKQHNCFLCSIPIGMGTKHDTWACLGDGSVVRLRAHDDCQAYARDRLDGWTDGDGVEDNAVETDIWECGVTSDDDGGRAVDEAWVAKVLKTWPGLVAIVDKVRAAIASDNGDCDG